MSQQQFDLMLSVCNAADIDLSIVQDMQRMHGQWYLFIDSWGWCSTSELLRAKGAKAQ